MILPCEVPLPGLWQRPQWQERQRWRPMICGTGRRGNLGQNGQMGALRQERQVMQERKL